ncbi:siderophore-interacting protein [Psychrobacter sp.]|uniref:siderophore-interacting protein n=1 Tax=Psychrobacter sp. TaxID=56811 RepID=UPI0026483131|nr:siderophore-interacting protein [Psychrobacter sp.]MDN6276673.1 siderophore-interacting protein [Psychrobacter sp.]MDN6308931.1 siderophore-interacting protein [Psychrobacter sp.]
MAKPTPRVLDVKGIVDITPNMRRITLGGEGMHDFPVDQESAYIKLIFPQEEGRKPNMRTYTIIQQRDDEIDVDFVLHGSDPEGEQGQKSHKGLASHWAKTTEIGDSILVGGPGAKKIINNEADWFLLVADMTALPAVTVNLAQLPDDAEGYAVIEVISEADIQPLEKPKNIDIHWIVNPVVTDSHSPLLERVKMLTWLAGAVSVWAACEFNSMRALRHYFKQEKEVAKTHLYISSYWKLDNSENEHKVIKRQDAESDL